MDYAERVAALRRKCIEAGCDGFVSISAPDNFYLTGFLGSTSAVIVTADRAEFLCDFRYREQAQEQVKNFEIREAGASIMSPLGERLSQLGLKQTAFEPGAMTVAQRLQIEEGAGRKLKPVAGLVAALRLRKEDDEIGRIREALQLTEEALEAVLPHLEEGVAEREMAARIEYEFKCRGASGAAFSTIALFGARSSLPHGAPGERRLRRGDIVLFDCGCLLDGYCSDLTRTYLFDTIAESWFEEIYELTLTAQQVALEAAKPGMKGVELDAIARDLISDSGHGDRFGHGLGHGVGIEIHEGPRVSTLSEHVLEPGMVVTIEPGVYIPGQGGVRIEDMIAVTEEGCEVLTRMPKQLRMLLS
jgi:Xaa-Pro aminopeptidase